MASSHGKLGEFVASKEDWKSYTEHLQQYFAANNIDNAGKRPPILLSSCRVATYRLIKDIIAPKVPTEVSVDDIVAKMTTRCQPRLCSATVSTLEFVSCMSLYLST